MSIKSVTNDNVAEFVAERKGLGADVIAPEVKTEGVDSSDPADKDEGKDTPVETKPKHKNGVQERIDELTRQKKELDEFAQTEYEARLQATRRIAELEKQIEAIQTPEPKVEEEPEPDPEKYTDQKTYLKDWGAWNRKKAISEFQAAEQQRQKEEEQKRLVAEANARKTESLAAAREVFPDFDEAIRAADRQAEKGDIPGPTKMVAGLLSESDYQAHILYHLIKNPDEVAKLNGMRPAQAAIAIGRLETQFAKQGTEKKAGSSTESIPKPKLPEPTPTLGTGGGNAPLDMASPQAFTDYKRRRLDEIRQKRARK